MRVLHVIVGLGSGGAEKTMTRICRELSCEAEFGVLALTGSSFYYKNLVRSGTRVHIADLGRGSIVERLKKVVDTWRWLRSEEYDVVHAWMYHAELITGLLKILNRKQKIIWSERVGDLKRARVKKRTRLLARGCAVLSHIVPDKILYCSEDTREYHERIGYKLISGRVIMNGWDIPEWKVLELNVGRRIERLENHKKNRNELRLGMMARWAPQKDHETVLRMARMLQSRGKKVELWLAGKGMDEENEELLRLIEGVGISTCKLFGELEDVNSFLDSLDVLVHSTYGEGLANAVAEGLSRGVPTICTEVGGMTELTGDDYPYLTKIGDEVDMANKIEELLGKSCEEVWGDLQGYHSRMGNRFNVHRMTREINRLYVDLSR